VHQAAVQCPPIYSAEQAKKSCYQEKIKVKLSFQQQAKTNLTKLFSLIIYLQDATWSQIPPNTLSKCNGARSTATLDVHQTSCPGREDMRKNAINGPKINFYEILTASYTIANSRDGVEVKYTISTELVIKLSSLNITMPPPTLEEKLVRKLFALNYNITPAVGGQYPAVWGYLDYYFSDLQWLSKHRSI
jgi:hypothetical protein